jgi:hypothetical protein
MTDWRRLLQTELTVTAQCKGGLSWFHTMLTCTVADLQTSFADDVDANVGEVMVPHVTARVSPSYIPRDYKRLPSRCNSSGSSMAVLWQLLGQRQWSKLCSTGTTR